ncbi:MULTISPECIES: aromatic-ring-hydroxylating dioxygenase subunit beta [unclassified Rhodococcus (in: high G+C Gram-positive bacteria)]|uniref:aromatic-ring-hydroxylating dioxygenase subunit beta n=1 Tax=unclassified Rhodococcus (in: high G+C Gram-positive bacteria) TaxID=192944 RepID=UPI000A05F71A|nr:MULTISPECIES: aromatic-ring-hydroxylating dioxygenase subunit beta [unclassified Rhodococcus (in: high G+C Gram-positive bacteria)]
MTEITAERSPRKPKPKPGAWAPSLDARSLPVAFVPTTDERVVRGLDLIAREAELLDHKNYEGWQGLYTEDAHYVIPIDPDATDFDNTLNMVYDDARMRRLRVARMTEGYAIAAVDSAKTVRTIGRVVPGMVTDDALELRVAQTLIAYKRGRHDIWSANVDFVIALGASPAQDRIERKVVRLIDGKDAVPAAGFLL